LNVQRDFSVIFKDKEWVKKTLIGGAFLMIPPFFFLSFGFIARFIYNRLETGNKKLPSWDKWNTLSLKGIEWSLIILLYSAIPVLFFSLLPGSMFVFLVNPKFVILNLNMGGFFILCFSFFLCFLAMFFLPMALILFSDSGSFAKAVKFKTIYEHIKNRLTYYLFAYLLTVFLVAFDFFLHLLLNIYILQFGLIVIYFLFIWIGFIIMLISASLFIESF
jgi:hypothetical protein